MTSCHVWKGESIGLSRDLMEWAMNTQEIAAQLMAANPTLNHITATIIAGDVLSAEKATERVNEGEDATRALVMVGSYARWDWVLAMLAAGKISDDWFAEHIADLWRGADPDDTAPQNLAVWQRMYRIKGGLIRDGRPLPKARADGTLKVFRGVTDPTGLSGIAWTTDPKIAAKFAKGAGLRIPVAGGVVVTGTVQHGVVLAYLTERGESEVIVDPRFVTDIHPVTAKVSR